MHLRAQLRLRLSFRQALNTLKKLLRRITAAKQHGYLGSMQDFLQLNFLVPTRVRRSSLHPNFRRLAQEPSFKALWRQLRQSCGTSLPPNGNLWLERQLRAIPRQIPPRKAFPTGCFLQGASSSEKAANLNLSANLGSRHRRRYRKQLVRKLGQFGYCRHYALRCTGPGRWLQRRLRRLRRLRRTKLGEAPRRRERRTPEFRSQKPFSGKPSSPAAPLGKPEVSSFRRHNRRPPGALGGRRNPKFSRRSLGQFLPPGLQFFQVRPPNAAVCQARAQAFRTQIYHLGLCHRKLGQTRLALELSLNCLTTELAKLDQRRKMLGQRRELLLRRQSPLLENLRSYQLLRLVQKNQLFRLDRARQWRHRRNLTLLSWALN